MARFEFTIDSDANRKRIDEFLFERFSDIGKKYLRSVLKNQKCEINGYVANAGIRLRKNDFVELEIDDTSAKKILPEKMEIEIVFEDSEIIVVNKPIGMLVHPTPRHREGTLLNGLTYHLNRENIEKFIEKKSECRLVLVRPGLAHRLDQQTSGLMVVAKNARALRVLNDHFKRKLVTKKYVAMVEGNVKTDDGTIDAPIGRYPEMRHWNVKSDGKSAETRYRVIERFANATLLELEPITGRTNQLRIHCAYIGHPIMGDEWHGKREFPRLCLHAAGLSFRHPKSGEVMEMKNAIVFEQLNDS